MPLDCVQDHRVYIHDRGGVNRFGELVTLNRVRWGRLRDDISEGEVDMFGASCELQADFLRQIEPGRHELVIYRNDVRVWEGPIVRMTYDRSGVQIYAKDVLHYTYRTIMHARYDNSYPNIDYVTNRAAQVLAAELTRKEADEQAVFPALPSYNVVPHIVNHHTATDAKTSRVTTPFEMTVFEHVDDLAARAGIDYTVVGRAIHLWDTSKPLGYAPQMTESDILGELYVSVYGMELGTKSVVVASDGTYGIAGGIDPYYGEVERLATAYDEGGEGSPPPTPADLASQAQRNNAGRNPTPLQVRIPDNSTLNPKGVLSVEDLVPGVYVPLLATLPARTISQMQKIFAVNFEETAEGEVITMTMTPATDPDPLPDEEDPP